MVSDTEIINASKENIDELIIIERESFKTNRLTDKKFTYFIKSQAKNTSIFLIIKSNNIIAGYIICSINKINKSSRIYSLAIGELFRERGLGRLLMDTVINTIKNTEVKKIFLEVSTKNQVAIGLYKTLGFETIKTLLDYYEDGSDAYKMMLKL